MLQENSQKIKNKDLVSSWVVAIIMCVVCFTVGYYYNRPQLFIIGGGYIFFQIIMMTAYKTTHARKFILCCGMFMTIGLIILSAVIILNDGVIINYKTIPNLLSAANVIIFIILTYAQLLIIKSMKTCETNVEDFAILGTIILMSGLCDDGHCC